MSRTLELLPYARMALGDNDRTALEQRARSMGVRVHAGRSVRRACWRVVVSAGSVQTTLLGAGPLAAVIAGALDDFETVAAA